MKIATHVFIICVVLFIITANTKATIDFPDLQQDQITSNFKAVTVYETETGIAMGARFSHVGSGFVLDLIRIQSIPQGFIWVNSSPPSDQGEPHTCEHLLLGKGTKGKYVSTLEGMSLGRSSAFTMQMQTCYHFHTSGGKDIFFKLLEEKLDAMIHPTFTDEDIRREVCNIGYKIDPLDSTLILEEKGTIYNEMKSGFERQWSNIFRPLDHMIFGENHPQALSSGGYPPAVRTMTPEDMWKFHGETHHLNNMGMVLTIPDDITIEECLNQLENIFKQIEPEITPSEDPATAYLRIPPANPAEFGQIKIVEFPNKNDSEPGLLIFGWPSNRTMDWNESYMFNLFVSCIGTGESSNLYKKFINSQTREIEIGATAVYNWFSDNPGFPLFIGLPNVDQKYINEEMIDSIRTMIIDEFKTIAAYQDGSEELKEFNERALNGIISERRSLRNFLNQPPGFGFRGSGAGWFSHLQELSKSDGFRKKLTMNERLAAAEELLISDKNIWKKYIENWKLTSPIPFAVAGRPNPDLIKRKDIELKERLDLFTASLKKKYNVDTDREAILLYKNEYDSKTAIIEAAIATIEMPGFVENPPLTLDQSINYTVEKLPGNADFVFSKFDNITLANVGLAFDMNVIPEELLPYAALLPTMLNEVGVIKDSKPIPYEEFSEIIKKEISSLYATFDVNPRTNRNELIISTTGSNLEESEKALAWLSTLVFSPDWRVENLARIRDAVDFSLSRYRNRMQGSEESWVDDPATAFREQANPLHLATNSFLTKTHFIYRMRWKLKEASNQDVQNEFNNFIDDVKKAGVEAEDQKRDKLLFINSSEVDQASLLETGLQSVYEKYHSLSDEAKKLADDALNDLKKNLTDIPDDAIATDWKYLCQQMKDDLAISPSISLNKFNDLMNLLLHKDNYRAYMTGSSASKEKLTPIVINIANQFDSTPSTKQTYSNKQFITERYLSRFGASSTPLYVGLINENTSSGVFVNSAASASFADNAPDTLLKFLSARLYGGWGAHSMFMKTWEAGLAYSNGLRHDEYAGKMIYYAERCPDLTQTMQFVVNELKKAPYDSSLADYAVAQAFYVSRDASDYSTRGYSIAADLADGLTPEVVNRFRQGVLDIRKTPGFYDKIQSRMESTYGEILTGYGPKLSEVPHANHFVIGSSKQFGSYQKYLKATEGEVILHKLYPRDFWMNLEK